MPQADRVCECSFCWAEVGQRCVRWLLFSCLLLLRHCRAAVRSLFYSGEYLFCFVSEFGLHLFTSSPLPFLFDWLLSECSSRRIFLVSRIIPGCSSSVLSSHLLLLTSPLATQAAHLCHSPVRDRACGRRGGLLSGWHIGSVHDDQPCCAHADP